MAHAQPFCSNTGENFPEWIGKMSEELQQEGFGKKSLSALKGLSYQQDTIALDRNQKSFQLNLEEFLYKRGARFIIRRARFLKKKYSYLFQDLEEKYGVPAGPLLAIWGMETAFGTFIGTHPTLSCLATLAYDCRRSSFFMQQFKDALRLVDQGEFSPRTKGAVQGEVGQTQFLPTNLKLYGVSYRGGSNIDVVHNSADALASTANFLQQKGWQRGGAYQEGEINFSLFSEWNSAAVYQKALAYIAGKIDKKEAF